MTKGQKGYLLTKVLKSEYDWQQQLCRHCKTLPSHLGGFWIKGSQNKSYALLIWVWPKINESIIKKLARKTLMFQKIFFRLRQITFAMSQACMSGFHFLLFGHVFWIHTWWEFKKRLFFLCLTPRIWNFIKVNTSNTLSLLAINT